VATYSKEDYERIANVIGKSRAEVLERRQRYDAERKGLGTEANVLLRNDARNNSARLCIKPRDLINAMYTQLALAIDGNVNLRSCLECRNWFTLEAGRGRSDKEYCSNACRMRAYRKRKGSC
jgi:hypothetical protein